MIAASSPTSRPSGRTVQKIIVKVIRFYAYIQPRMNWGLLVIHWLSDYLHWDLTELGKVTWARIGNLVNTPPQPNTAPEILINTYPGYHCVKADIQTIPKMYKIRGLRSFERELFLVKVGGQWNFGFVTKIKKPWKRFFRHKDEFWVMT